MSVDSKKRLDYMRELGSLIQGYGTVTQFKTLYKKYFDEDAPEDQIEAFRRNSGNYEYYQEDNSYDDSYDSY
jgi:hypothetical protein